MVKATNILFIPSALLLSFGASLYCCVHKAILDGAILEFSSAELYLR